MRKKHKVGGKILTLPAVGAVVLAGAPAAFADIRNATPAARPGPEVLRLSRGSHVTLPLQSVTRVIAEDDEVARARFANGKAIIEGVTTGSTTVEVYQGGLERKLYKVQVVDGDVGTIFPAPAVTTRLPAPAPAPAHALAVPAGEVKAISGPASPPPAVPAPAAAIATKPGATVSGAALNSSPAAITATGGAAATGTGRVGGTQAGRSPLYASLRVAPAEDNPSQAVVSISYGNRGPAVAQAVSLHYALDDSVAYVTGSATGGAHYDTASRELVWNLGELAGGANGQPMSFRVAPIDNNSAITFNSVATIEDSSQVSVSSNPVAYRFAKTALLTVFALPDRILAGRNAPVLVDVRGVEYQTAVDRMQKVGVVRGREPGLFFPDAATERAEYAVMTLNGLNLRDVRDLTSIKFVLGRRSAVNLEVLNSQGKLVATLVRNVTYDPGERSVYWDGRSGTGFAPPGRYTYVCSARDLTQTRGNNVTTLRGQINIVPQAPIEPNGMPSFVDVKSSDWYAGYLAIAEKQAIIQGYPDKSFKPTKPINRVEATAIVVRAMGLEDLVRRAANKDAGFLDYQNIPAWAVGYINIASVYAKTNRGKAIMRGYPSNLFQPMRPLRRDEAALIVQRLVDKETTRQVSVSGQLVPGAAVSINGKQVSPTDDGQFQFVITQNTAEPMTVSVADARP